MRRLTCSLGLVAGIFACTTALADVPHVLHYQGYLTDNSGAPVHCPDVVSCPDQQFDLTFRLYQDPFGGQPLWSETHEAVGISHGVFNASLGSLEDLDPASLDDPTYLGVNINGTGELVPRQHLVASAFSVRAELAEDAANLGGLPAESFPTIEELPGLCVTTEQLEAAIIEISYLDEDALGLYLTENGYVPGPQFSGAWAELVGVPADLLDGDNDTLAALTCEAGQLPKWSGAHWVCSQASTVSAEEVEGIIEDMGLAVAEDLSEVATTGSYVSLLDVPPVQLLLDVDAAGNLTYEGNPIITDLGSWVGDSESLNGAPGAPGKHFQISKIYNSMEALNGDVPPTGVEPGEFAIINTGDVNNLDNGKLYILEEGNWNFVVDMSGSAGPQGIEGPEGPAGPQGTQGIAGPQGPQGIQGPEGDPGFQGPQGEQGPQGVEGPQGAQGPSGEAGVAGIPGPAGSSCSVVDNGNGTKILTCEDGTTVLVTDGIPGPAGADGVAGVDGPPGADGPPGDDGALAGKECSSSEYLVFNGADWICTTTTIDPDQISTEDGSTNMLLTYDGDKAGWSKLTEIDELVTAHSGIRLGSNAPPCDPGHAGTIYYDATDKQVVLCDGSDLKTLITTCSGDCPSADSVACGQPLLDECGAPCAGNATGIVCPGNQLCTGGACTSCGNGDLDDGEECDDGNQEDGDGCDASCVTEASPQIAMGNQHSCHLSTDGVSTCWGYNYYGMSDPQFDNYIQITAGHRHTCGIKLDNTLACWGYDSFGQVSEIPAGTYTQISAGEYHNCALRDDGIIKCWGYADHGECDAPAGTYLQVAAGGDYSCAMDTEGLVSCWGSVSFDQTKAPDGNFVNLKVNNNHGCALKSTGQLLCWGYDAYGQVDDIPIIAFQDVAVGGYHTCGLEMDGSVSCWGLNSNGQASPPNGETFTSISAGGSHTCGINQAGNVLCWGWDKFGQATPPEGL